MATRSSRRVGYGIAIAVNIGLLVVVLNLVSWGWFPWLTEEFDEVVPYLVASIAATMLVNAAYFVFDPPWFKSLTELGTLVLSMIATVRLLGVFPFDFSAYDFPWGTLARSILGLAIFGIAVAMIAQLAKLAGYGRFAREASEELRQLKD